MSDATVTIRELATALNHKPEQVEREAAELGMLVRPDWQGRPSLRVDEARGLTTGEARRHLEHEAAWRQHQVDTKAWVEGRSRAIAEAAAGVRRRQAPEGRGMSPRRPGMPPSRPVSSTRSATHGRCSATAFTPSACCTPRCRHER